MLALSQSAWAAFGQRTINGWFLTVAIHRNVINISTRFTSLCHRKRRNYASFFAQKAWLIRLFTSFTIAYGLPAAVKYCRRDPLGNSAAILIFQRTTYHRSRSIVIMIGNRVKNDDKARKVAWQSFAALRNDNDSFESDVRDPTMRSFGKYKTNAEFFVTLWINRLDSSKTMDIFNVSTSKAHSSIFQIICSFIDI
jgi:hypothetical protein